MNKEEYTFEEKVVWLSNLLGYKIEETTLHNPGQFIEEVEQDFKQLYYE